MPDMADIVLAECAEFENQLDSYVSGDMSLHEAYELGIVDEMGSEQSDVQNAWDRAPIGALDEINNSLKISELEFDLAEARKQSYISSIPNKTVFSRKATANLSKELPTCNICERSMVAQEGKYGKFYFCDNRCKGQSTVSDKYWQSLRK